MVTRRALLSTFLAASGVSALDPERLLWVPGAKKIFIPAPKPAHIWKVGDLLTIDGCYKVNPQSLDREVANVNGKQIKFPQLFHVFQIKSNGDIVLFPPIIESGHYKNVDLEFPVKPRNFRPAVPSVFAYRSCPGVGAAGDGSPPHRPALSERTSASADW